MIIAQVEPPHMAYGGDYFYRTHAPGMAMAQEEGIYVVNLTSQHRMSLEIMSQADVLILNDICDPDLLYLARERKSRGKPTVYEIGDDLTSLQTWNPVYFFYKNPENVALSLRLASYCDALQVSVPYLRSVFGYLNGICEVFPNHIMPPPDQDQTRKHSHIVIGWGGSHGHLEDVAEMARPLMEWIASRTDVVLHLMCSEPIWRLFRELPDHKKMWRKPGSIEDYYRFLSYVDIGIGPIRNTPFNLSRSDVKFLEYAVSGTVPVMACLEPYQHSVREGETGYLFKSQEELIGILNRLMADRNLLNRIADNARRYVLDERMQMKRGRERTDLYTQLINQQDPKESAPAEAGRQSGKKSGFEKWSGMEGAVRNERHLRLMPTRFEECLYSGLVASQVDEDKDKARQYFETAEQLEPLMYQTYLFGYGVSPDPIGSLGKALQLNPNSLKATLLLGEELAGIGDVLKAFESFDAAIRIFPDYDIPFLRAAVLLEKIGEQAQAETMYDKAKQLAVRHPTGS